MRGAGTGPGILGAGRPGPRGTAARLGQTNAANTTETTVFTATAPTLLKQVVVANVTATDATTSLSLVPTGGAAGVANRLYEQVTVPARSTLVFDFAQVMATGDFISVRQGTASACTTTCSGVTH